jgi:hypothetical protein
LTLAETAALSLAQMAPKEASREFEAGATRRAMSHGTAAQQRKHMEQPTARIDESLNGKQMRCR